MVLPKRNQWEEETGSFSLLCPLVVRSLRWQAQGWKDAVFDGSMDTYDVWEWVDVHMSHLHAQIIPYSIT